MDDKNDCHILIKWTFFRFDSVAKCIYLFNLKRFVFTVSIDVYFSSLFGAPDATLTSWNNCKPPSLYAEKYAFVIV